VRKNVWLERSLLIGLLIFTILLGFTIMKNKGYFDKESGIRIENLNKNQVENMYKLCKVWGSVKYYHPKVVAFSVNWDYELFGIMPEVIEAGTSAETDKILYNWINKLGEVKEGTAGDKRDVMAAPDIDWIKDEKFISKELSGSLVKLQKSAVTIRIIIRERLS